MVNEPLVFELLNFYCIIFWRSIFRSLNFYFFGRRIARLSGVGINLPRLLRAKIHVHAYKDRFFRFTLILSKRHSYTGDDRTQFSPGPPLHI